MMPPHSNSKEPKQQMFEKDDERDYETEVITKVEFHPLGDFLTRTTTGDQKKIDLVGMYKQQKQKEEDLKMPSGHHLELERKIAEMTKEMAQMKQALEEITLKAQETEEMNNVLTEELEECRENEIKYVSKINHLEQVQRDQSSYRSINSTQDSDSDSHASRSTDGVTTSISLDRDQMEAANMQICLGQSHAENYRLRKIIDEMETQMKGMGAMSLFVHHTDELENRRSSKWLFSNSQTSVRSVEALLWADSTRSI